MEGTPSLLLLLWYGVVGALLLGWGAVLLAALPSGRRLLDDVPAGPADHGPGPLVSSLWTAVLGGALVTGLAVLAFGGQPLESQVRLANSLAADGSAERAARLLAAAPTRLLTATVGLALLGASAIGWTWRERSIAHLSHRWRTLRPVVGEMGSDLRQMLAAAVSRIRGDGGYLIWLLLLTLLGVGLRLAFVRQPMRYDEAFTYLEYASHGVNYTVSQYTLPNNHILHTLLVTLSTRLLGDSPDAIRLPALLAGAATVPLGYLAARAFYSRQAALLAAGLVASSSGLIEYSTNARGYSLTCLITLLLFGLAAYVRRQPNRAAWGLLATFAALGHYLVPTMLFPVGGVLLWLAVCWLRRETSYPPERIFPLFLATTAGTIGLITVLLYLPALAPANISRLANRGTVDAVGLDQTLRDMGQWVLDTAGFWGRDVPVVVGALLVVGLVTHTLFRRRLDGTKTSLVLAFVASAAIVSLALGRLTLKSGVWLFLLPLAIIWSSAGLAFLWQQVRTRSDRARDAIFATLVLAVSVWLGWRVIESGSILRSRATGTLPSAEQVASYLGDETRSGDAIAALYPSDALIHYYQRRHGAPDLPFYRRGDALPATRLLAVVNTTIEQPLETVIDRLGLTPRLDLASARPLKVFETAVIVEIPVVYGHGSAEGQEGK